MILRKPKINEIDIYKKLEIEFYLHHKPIDTLLQDIDPRKRSLSDLRKEFSKSIKQRNAFFRFVEVDSNVAGYIYGTIKQLGPNEKSWKQFGYLNVIIVSKKSRHQGLAEFMIREFFSWLRFKGIKYVEVSSNVKNKPILRLNKKMGFKEQMIKFGKII